LPEEDEDEDEDEEEEEESSEESDPEPSEKHVADLPMKYAPSKADPSEVSCGAIAHPYSCDCKGVSVFDETSKHPAVKQPVRPSVAKPLKPAIVNVDRPIHSVVARPRNDVRRARSYSNPSQSSSRTQSSSRSASRSPSPPVRSPPPQTFHAAYTSPLANDARNVPQSPPSRAADNEGLRSRLHSLLSNEPYISTSPPKSSTFSASIASREGRPSGERSVSPSRSPSPPTSSNLRRHSTQTHRSYQSQQNNADQISRLLASHQPVIPSGIQPPVSTSPNARTSSASDAARALEQSKRDRRLADEEERNRRRPYTERERSYPEREAERVRSPSSNQVISSTYTAVHQPSGPGMQLPGGPLTSRPSFSSGSMAKAPVSAYAPSSQLVPYSSRYPNVTNGKVAQPSHPGIYSS
jgi:hypothetical protein